LARYKDSRAREILDLGNYLYDKRKPLDSLLQDVAWQFAPDLAEFQSPLELGEDWGADRMDGTPEMLSRELSNQLGVMLRPIGKQWFRSSTGVEDLDRDEEVARFNDYVSTTMRREMYRAKTGFVQATKQCDRFYTNFGMGVMSIEESPTDRDHLFYRNHHIKDVVWLDNQLGIVDHLHRRVKMTARTLVRLFPESALHDTIIRAARREPNKEFEIRYVTMPSDEYDSYGQDIASKKRRKLPFVQAIIDVENCCIIKEGTLPVFNYIVPRWMRLSSSQYAFSPAAMTSLPDGRMAQMLSQILLESGEKAIEPPMIGKKEAVLGEPSLAAGGLSWVDMEHEGKLTDVLDVVKIEADMRVGFQMRVDLREMLAKAWYIDKLNLPESGAKEMTAFEVARRLEEHIRNLLPIFEPIQVEYNAAMLDTTFQLLVNMKKIDFSLMPDSMSAIDTEWEFETPIQSAESRLLVEQFIETTNVVTVGQQTGATSVPVHLDLALRDAVRGVGGPAAWRVTMAEQQAEAEETAQAQGVETMLQQVTGGAMAAEQVGKAGQALGMITPPGKAAAAGGGGQGAPQGAAPAQSGGAQPLPQGMPAGVDMGAAIQAVQGMMGGAGEQLDAETPITMATRAPSQAGPNPEIAELKQMMKMLAMQVSILADEISKPKEISVKRDSKGKIIGASSGRSSGKLIEQRAA
jgi:hypothetical protein